MQDKSSGTQDYNVADSLYNCPKPECWWYQTMLCCSQKLWESNYGITSFTSQRKQFSMSNPIVGLGRTFSGDRMSIQCCGFAVRSVIVCSQGKRFKKDISGKFHPSSVAQVWAWELKSRCMKRLEPGLDLRKTITCMVYFTLRDIRKASPNYIV